MTKAEVAHLVERQLPKLQVAGSSPVFRSGDAFLTAWAGLKTGCGRPAFANSNISCIVFTNLS